MDPITVLSLASAAATLVQVGFQIVKHLDDLSKAGDLPQAFRDIRTRLPLILSIVSSVEKTCETLPPDAQSSLKAVIESCYLQIEQVEKMLQKVTVVAGESKWRKITRAAVSLVEESRIQKVSAALRYDIELLTLLNVTPSEKSEKAELRRPSTITLGGNHAPPSYADVMGLFLVPFTRDDRFVGRNSTLNAIDGEFEKYERVSMTGPGGVGKSQVAIEYAYRFKEANEATHVFWVYGGSVPRFYQGYKKIAQGLNLPGWEDPDVPVLDLVANWLNSTRSSYLLILDNADDMLHYWPNKYKSSASSDKPATDLSAHLPEIGGKGKVLITSRDYRVASRLARPSKPIVLPHMSLEEAQTLFQCDLEAQGCRASDGEVEKLVQALDCLPLAVTQAAAFIDENCITVSEYLAALEGGDAAEFLQEELDDARRDEDSINSVFRTWKVSFEQISKQKSQAAELLSLLGMLDRQSIPKWLVKLPEVVTSAGVLQAFSLISCPEGSESFQLHRLCQRFVRLWLKRSGQLQKWQDAALKCVAQAYPTEIGFQEWPICDALAPHVATVAAYEYQSEEARLDLAHTLCWSADFDVERGLYGLALSRSRKSLELYKELVPPTDKRLAASLWGHGRLMYYEARSQADLLLAKQTLEAALDIADPCNWHYAETTFELAHVSYTLGEEEQCLKMGKASFECFKRIEGMDGVRTMDNMHDYALELAMFGHYDEAISHWQQILDACPKSNASENTKAVYMYRSMASIAEFRGDAEAAETLYAKLVKLGSSVYGNQHVHVFDYRLSHAEQVLRLNRPKQAMDLCQSILATSRHKSEWRIAATSYEIMAECCNLEHDGPGEEEWRLKCAELHSMHLENGQKEGMDALEAAARCLLNNRKPDQAEKYFQQVITWREAEFGPNHPDTLEALEYLGICKAYQGRDAEAATCFERAATSCSEQHSRVAWNLCSAQWNQQMWEALERDCRRALANDEQGQYAPTLRQMLTTAVSKLGRGEEALGFMTLQSSSDSSRIREGSRILPEMPPERTGFPPRFGRIIHPRTWSA